MPFYEKVNKRFSLPLSFSRAPLSPANVAETRGVRLVWINGSCGIGEEMAAALEENGVKYLVTKSSGIDHLDLDALRRHSLHAANVPEYSPNAISEHSLMLALSCLRHLKRALAKQEAGDYTLEGLCGRELRSMTAGVVGTGRIGRETLKLLRGFGCRILAHSHHPVENDRDFDGVEFVSYDRILRLSDVLFFHCPMRKENYHMVNSGNIPLLREGAVLINTARGGLFDYAAVLRGLREGRIGALGLDVYEGERAFVGRKGDEAVPDAVFEALRAMNNVIFTPHIGFLTETSVEALITGSAENTVEYLTTGRCRNEVVF